MVIAVAGIALLATGVAAVFVSSSAAGAPTLLVIGVVFLWTAALGQLPIRLSVGGNQIDYLLQEAAAAKAEGDDQRAEALTETALRAVAEAEVMPLADYEDLVLDVVRKVLPEGASLDTAAGHGVPTFARAVRFADGTMVPVLAWQDAGALRSQESLARKAAENWEKEHSPLTGILTVLPSLHGARTARAAFERFLPNVAVRAVVWRPGLPAVGFRRALSELSGAVPPQVEGFTT